MELWDWIFVIHFLLRPSDYTMSMTLPVHNTVETVFHLNNSLPVNLTFLLGHRLLGRP